MIKRIRGIFKGRNKTSGYKDLVFTVATAKEDSLSFKKQMKQTLKTLDLNLKEMHSSKKNILSAQVYISDMTNKQKMDKIWCKWIGKNKDKWPQRACLGVALEGNIKIEITLIAVKKI